MSELAMGKCGYITAAVLRYIIGQDRGGGMGANA